MSSNFEFCLNFIFNFYINLQNQFNIDKKEATSYVGCMTFEWIYSEKQLILPFLFNELMCEEKVPENEIHLFKNFY